MIPSAILLAVVAMHPVIRAEALVAKLGGPSYAGREKVGKELVALGRASIGSLKRGMSNRDPEIVERCRRLLPAAEVEAIRQRVAFLLETPPKPVPSDVPLAKRLFAITGDTREARQLYVEIYVANSSVLESIDRAGPNGGKVFWEWAHNVLNPAEEAQPFGVTPQLAPAPRQVITRADVALYWLLSTDPAFKPDKGNRVVRQAHQFDKSAAARDAVTATSGSALRRLLLARLTGPRNYESVGLEATCVQAGFKLAGDAKLKEVRPIALKFALDKDEWHVVRAASLMSLMQIGKAEDIKAISTLIDDNTTLGASKAGHTMLGDVALATCVVLSDRQLKDFGFKFADEGIAEGSTDPLHFGFFEAGHRTAAREKWKALRDAQSSNAGGKR